MSTTKIQELKNDIDCISKKRKFLSKLSLGCTIAYGIPAIICSIINLPFIVLYLTLAYAFVMAPLVIVDNNIKCKKCALMHKLKYTERMCKINQEEAQPFVCCKEQTTKTPEKNTCGEKSKKCVTHKFYSYDEYSSQK